MNAPPIIVSPWVGFIGTVSGIVGIVLSFVLYFWAVKAPELTYAINPVRTSVLQSEIAAGLRVLHNNEEIKGDVTAVQIAIWNNGREPITKDKILAPIKIATKPFVRILEAKIRTQSRKEIEFSLDPGSLKIGMLPVSWKILEKSDGASVQLIYAGPVNIDITLEGAVIGQRNISPARYPYTRTRQDPENLTSLSMFIVVTVMWGFFATNLYQLYKGIPKTWVGKLFVFGGLILTGSLAIAGTYLWSTLSRPPFGF